MTTLRNASGDSASPGMIDGAVIARARAEYREMPGLCLTIQQACRLWQIDPATCTRILEGLVAERFLKRTPAGAFIAAALGRPERSIRLR